MSPGPHPAPPPPARHDLAVSLALATLPRPLVAAALGRMVRALPRRHPKLAQRLAEMAGKRLLIVPDELPYAFLLAFPAGRLSITLVEPDALPAADARMGGPLRLFYDLVRGGRDGDALFFSREMAVTGDMAAAVTLRNAMDGSGVDLFAEFLDLPGPLGPAVRGAGAVLDRCAAVLLGPLAARAARLETEVVALRAELRRVKEAGARPRPKPTTSHASAMAAALGVKP
jgi:O2-independent ubiquinone biosynthesis accessory factor UbiT